MPQDQNIPYGLCQCGCGKTTNVAAKTSTRQGQKKGQHLRFLTGHNTRFKKIIPTLEVAAPFWVEGDYCRLITLSRGLYAIVNEWDYERLMQHKWCALWNPDIRSFYALRNAPKVNGKSGTIFMHREVLGLEDRKLKGEHRDPMRTLENTIKNLRVATNAQNSMNSRKRRDNTSGFKGVTWCKQHNAWKSQIAFQGKHIQIGIHGDPYEGHLAYCAKAKELFGEFWRAE